MRSAAHSRGWSTLTAVDVIVVTAFILTGVLAVVNVALWLVSV